MIFVLILLISSGASADSPWDSPCFRFTKNGNLRSGPNTALEIIGKAAIGDIVCFIRYAGDDPKSSWYSFSDNGGIIYYFQKSLGEVYATRGAAEYAGKQARRDKANELFSCDNPDNFSVLNKKLAYESIKYDKMFLLKATQVVGLFKKVAVTPVYLKESVFEDADLEWEQLRFKYSHLFGRSVIVQAVNCVRSLAKTHSWMQDLHSKNDLELMAIRVKGAIDIVKMYTDYPRLKERAKD